MKKTFIFCCFMILIGTVVASSISLDLGNLGETETNREIILTARRDKPTRSAFPEVKAYINNDLLTVSINQSLDCEVYICLYDEEDEIAYSGTYIFTNNVQPEIEMLLNDLDETQTYFLVIELQTDTDTCYYSGEF